MGQDKGEDQRSDEAANEGGAPSAKTDSSVEAWLIWNEGSDRHHPPGDHAERPGRLAGVRRGVDAAESRGLRFRSLPSRAVDDATLQRGHSAGHLERVAAACRHSQALDEDTYTTPASEAVARTAVGAAVDLCEAVLGESGPRVGFAAVRPPGHHAERDRPMGFCLYSNVALAALEMQARGLAKRIAVVDWDVHHGNGTENVLWDRDDLLFISLHQHPLYPGTGAMVDVGEGPGTGWSLNLPVPAGTGDGDFVMLFDEIVVPLLARVDPDLVIVSAGYDAHSRDPLAALKLTGAGFGWMTQRLISLQRPIAAVLEGGYDLIGLEEGVAATLDAFAGRYPDGEVPLPSPSVDRLADRARSVLRPAWGDLEAP